MRVYVQDAMLNYWELIYIIFYIKWYKVPAWDVFACRVAQWDRQWHISVVLLLFHILKEYISILTHLPLVPHISVR